MNLGKAQAATGAAARVVSPIRLYATCPGKSMAIDDILGRLLFGLAIPHITLSERQTVLNAIDGLIRLKIDAGLLRGGCR